MSVSVNKGIAFLPSV